MGPTAIAAGLFFVKKIVAEAVDSLFRPVLKATACKRVAG